MSRTACVAAALALVAAPSFAQDLDTGWRTYANARFGVSIDYPDIFSVRDPAPANGDGQSFRTADGSAKLRVYGSHNANRQTAAQLMRAYMKAGVDYVYSAAGGNWFVLSGVKGGEIGYLRCDLGPSDVVGCFEIEYPSDQAAKWARVVEDLGKSLRVPRNPS